MPGLDEMSQSGLDEMSQSGLDEGAQWLSGKVLDSRPKGRGFEPYRRHCVVSLSKNIYPSLVLVQPRKTRPFITVRLLMGHKESNQTYKQGLDEMSQSGLDQMSQSRLDEMSQSSSTHQESKMFNTVMVNFLF